jgi:hypothetical protein
VPQIARLMNVDFKTFLWTVLGAVVTAIASLLIPWLVARISVSKQRDLFREWESEYQGIDEPEGTWVSEKVKIDTLGGKIRLKNSYSSEGYDYTAIGRLVQNLYIIGEWTSMKAGANAQGCFVLTISPQGNALYGYWAGSDLVGSHRYGKWVIAPDKASIERTKEIINEMSKSRLAPAKSKAEDLPKNLSR